MASAAEPESATLDEIVVTATRIETAVQDVARSISIVQKNRIQNATQQLGLDEALAGIPGLYIQNRYNFSQDLRIAMRGFGARSSFGIRGIKILVDDIPETLPDGQAQVDSIDLGSAEQIEVLRGPASSLYSNASGGVISIRSELGGPVPFVEGMIAAGELGYEKYQLKVAGQLKSADYLFNASHQDFDGYRGHSASASNLLNSKLRWTINEGEALTVVFNHTRQPDELDPGGINAAQVLADPRSAYAPNVLFNAGEDLSQQRLGLTYRSDHFGGDLLLRNYYVWRDFANRLPFVNGGAVDLNRFFYGAGAQYSLSDPGPGNLRLTLGFDLDRQDDDRRRFDNNQGTLGNLVFDQRERVDSAGVYVQGQYELNARWSVDAGLRYDDLRYEVTDQFRIDGDDSGRRDFSDVSPSVSVSYHAGSKTVFAAYSNSFETPTTTELANPDGSGGLNQAIISQTADSYELGWRGGDRNLRHEIAIFHIDLEDELIPFELAEFPGRTFYSNAGSSSRSGAEMALTWGIADGLSVEASYTWSDFRFDGFVDDDGNDFSGNALPGLPRHFGYLGVHYESEHGFSATLESSYSGDLYANTANNVEVSSYSVTNLRIGHRFRRGDWTFRPYLGINNLFSERYNNNIRINAFGGRYYEPAPERNFYAGIVARFE
ncbi:MAG: TonB-dependent receptor [Woeseiaceae bacterium]|nr:TonB-dependent receptor [Woeseiaceae bacterium]